MREREDNDCFGTSYARIFSSAYGFGSSNVHGGVNALQESRPLPAHWAPEHSCTRRVLGRALFIYSPGHI